MDRTLFEYCLCSSMCASTTLTPFLKMLTLWRLYSGYFALSQSVKAATSLVSILSAASSIRCFSTRSTLRLLPIRFFIAKMYRALHYWWQSNRQIQKFRKVEIQLVCTNETRMARFAQTVHVRTRHAPVMPILHFRVLGCDSQACISTLLAFPPTYNVSCMMHYCAVWRV